MKRRELLQILGWATTATMTNPALTRLDADEHERVARAVTAPSRVDETVIGHIEDVLWIAKRQDDKLGAQAALDTVLAQRNLVRLLLPECPAECRPQLLTALSSASNLAGWMSFDLNDFTSAAYYYQHARTAAHEADNDELAASVLINMSYLATWTGKPREGIDYALAAQGWAGKTTHRHLQAWAHDIAARAYAAYGLHDACMRELDHAHARLAEPSGEPGRIRFYYDAADDRCGPAFLTGIRGRCLLQLGRTGDAVRVTEATLPLLDPTYVRNVAIRTAELGSGYAKLGEIEHAAKLVGDAGVLAARNSSGRLMSQVLAARADLTRWQQTPAVRELDERLAACQIAPLSP